jgi:hypothetical protein
VKSWRRRRTRFEKIEYYEVVYGDDFKRNTGRLVRRKRFRSLPDQIEELEIKLSQGTFEGDIILHYDEPIEPDDGETDGEG